LKQICNKITKINDKIALRFTFIFGTMWMTYLFFLYGLTPLFFPQYMNKLLYWSNTVQLWSLPLLMVGTNLLGANAEKRAEQDHEMITKEFSEIKELLELERSENAELHMIFDELQKVISEINKNK
jgi:hypothetical protein